MNISILFIAIYAIGVGLMFYVLLTENDKHHDPFEKLKPIENVGIALIWPFSVYCWFAYKATLWILAKLTKKPPTH